MEETNHYAQAPNRNGMLSDRPRRKFCMVPELKAFFTVTLYMSMKRQPNVKTYWSKAPSIFHCPIISSVFTR